LLSFGKLLKEACRLFTVFDGTLLTYPASSGFYKLNEWFERCIQTKKPFVFLAGRPFYKLDDNSFK
jgi:hypothetical protein